MSGCFWYTVPTSVDLATFIEEILIGKLHFCAVIWLADKHMLKITLD